MKKVIFCAVALFVGGMTYAQVTDADGNSSPTPNVIAPISGSAAGANTGLSVQNGHENKVRVRQAGTSQSVYTFQDDGTTGFGENKADVRQTGAVSSASGVENAADVRQSGALNSSATRQEGDGNDAVTRQGQLDGSSTANKAKIRQGTGQQAQDNYAAIDQNGDNNWASTQQTYDNSDAWTQQTGDNNKSMILQDAGPNQTDGHYAMNQQEGNENESFISQQGNGARNAARAYQAGESNQAKQYQTATAGSGSANDAGIQQGIGVGGGYLTVAAEATTQWVNVINNVDPSSNPLPYYAPSDFNKALQVQVGDDNSAGILQVGGGDLGSNYGEQNQDGNGNNAGMVQSHYYSGDVSNYAKQEQDGNDNTAGLVQQGSNNKSYQAQDGDLNTSLAHQAGSGHKLNTHQFGDGSVAHAAQHGADNRALIVQYDGQSYSVQQNMNLGVQDLSAGGNQANILQMGPDGDFGAGAVDCDFDEPVNLDMNYNFPGVSLDDICGGC
ncbi:curlin [Aequorivita nionensis]|uniref:curlin n=1 Tax=Aequorivita nionensis TaxID=1287690 RepID=UPI0039658FC6